MFVNACAGATKTISKRQLRTARTLTLHAQLAALVAGVAVILAGCLSSPDDTSSTERATATATATSAPTTAPPKADKEEDDDDRDLAVGVLAALHVRDRSHDTFDWEFEQTEFEPTAYMGADTDDNGCDTYSDVLRRDLEEIVLKSIWGDDGLKCTVDRGIFHSPFTGETSPYALTGHEYSMSEIDPVNLDVAHLVTPGNAWASGAHGWPEERYEEFYNDPLNLLAVEEGVNTQRGNNDASDWLPANEGYRCEYVARQIAVYDKYQLAVTPAENDAMTRVLEQCPDFPAFKHDVSWPAAGAGDLAPDQDPQRDYSAPGSTPEQDESQLVDPQHGEDPTPEPQRNEQPQEDREPEPEDERESENGGGDVSYKNCDDVRAHGAAPIRPGDPGFEPKFDGNSDGVGCE